MAVDMETVGAAVARMKKLPDNAAASAAAAKEYSEAAQEAAASVTVATLAEAREYLGIIGE